MTIKEAIAKVIERKNLSTEETITVFNEIMSGTCTDAQIAAFIVALRLKGEDVDEITGAATVMREKAEHVIPAATENLVDTCGTGGDCSNTFNISTAAAFITAGAGARVAKHGNRSVSSKSGSADVLESLGINIGVSSNTMKNCLDEIGICFLFAPSLHKAMKYAIGPRREVGVRTIFNILGPLTNPALAPNQLLGVFNDELCSTLITVLKNLGSNRAFVVHGADGLDEVSVCADTRISELHSGNISTYVVKPEDYGIERASKESILGGSADHNADIIKKLLKGVDGPCRNAAVINAGFAICAAGLSNTPKEGVALANEAIDSGAAMEKLEKLREMTRD